MNPPTVSIVRYQHSGESVRRAVELAGGFPDLKPSSRVFIKPNIVFWTSAVPFPKWGVITTSRVVQDVVALLAEIGVNRITIGEGSIVMDPKDRTTQPAAYRSLGYGQLGKRYGVRCVNAMEGPFGQVDFGDGYRLRFLEEALASDLVIDLPVLKTHAQTVVSLGIKNLKGLIDIPSRKRCHNADPERDLHQWVSRLAEPFPNLFTLIDGIYSLERGPGFDGKAARSDLLVASRDPFSADLVGAGLLGYGVDQVPHLAHYAARHHRPTDLTGVTVAGETPEALSRPHEHAFPYNADGSLPAALERTGIRGLSYYRYDSTLCTYCSMINAAVLMAIAAAWKGNPWDEVEVLTGKRMEPRPGMKKTVLLGQCMCRKHKDNGKIVEAIRVEGCPPTPERIVAGLKRAGIDADPALMGQLSALPGIFMRRYEGKPEFEEGFFRVDG